MNEDLTLTNLCGYYRWHAHIYDATRWAFLFGRTALIRMVAERLSPRRILEVGCGTGRNLAALACTFPNAEIVGLDLSAEMLNRASKKVANFGSRVSLLQRTYSAPVSGRDPFDLIVFSYCLTMINPGYVEILRVCQQDLAPGGHLALVDFHDTSLSWFGRWMGLNHVRMDGQILGALPEVSLNARLHLIKPAYGGLWRWFICLAAR